MTTMKLLLPFITAGVVCAAPVNSIYQQKCSNCHGLKGEKSAMGKSAPINGMPSAKIEKALYEYSTGSRAAFPIVKTIKKTFVEANSKEQVHELAEYIHKL